MATAFAGFGTEVTVLARHGLLGDMEPFVGDAVVEGLRGLGATVRLGVRSTQVERDGSGEVVITLDDGARRDGRRGARRDRTPSAQRRPRPRDGRPRAGLVDRRRRDPARERRPMRDDGGWLYAVGDVNHRALLTHQGKYQARAAGDVIVARANGRDVDAGPWGVHAATADHSAVPGVVFSEPECRVRRAHRGGCGRGRLRGAESPTTDPARSAVRASSPTATRVGRGSSSTPTRGVVLGVTFVGQDVAELLQAATIAVVGEVPVDRLWHAVPAFPTMSEVWLRLLEAYGRPERPTLSADAADRCA